MSHIETAMSVISKVSGVAKDKITREMELVADLGLDSARALQLLVELEDSIGIEISDEDAALLNTVGDITGYVERL